jgi:soluble lytic murein transglycosylase-like protein
MRSYNVGLAPDVTDGAFVQPSSGDRLVICPVRVATLRSAAHLGRFLGVAAALAVLAGSWGMSQALAKSEPAKAATPGTSRVASAAAARAHEMVASAIRYEHAEGTTRDYARAHALYCEAARLSDPDALLRMGWMYANGRGVSRDDATAHTLFSRAAELGSEMGARLAAMIRAAPGAAPKPPDCLVARKACGLAPPPGSEFSPEAAIAAGFITTANSPAPRWLIDTVVPLAHQYKVDPRLVLAVVRAESNFNPLARSPKNAQGLMQLIPETAERFAVSDILDPAQNVRGGIRYLRWLLSYFRGDVLLSLAAYNAGEGAVNRYGGVPPFAETKAYVARIRALYPHARHPYDEGLAEASPVVAAERPADSRVTYFLGANGRPVAQSVR